MIHLPEPVFSSFVFQISTLPLNNKGLNIVWQGLNDVDYVIVFWWYNEKKTTSNEHQIFDIKHKANLVK